MNMSPDDFSRVQPPKAAFDVCAPPLPKIRLGLICNVQIKALAV
jgi:hypothetical protein